MVERVVFSSDVVPKLSVWVIFPGVHFPDEEKHVTVFAVIRTIAFNYFPSSDTPGCLIL